MRILVVDDTPSSRMITRALLKRLGHEPLEAADGAEAVELFREQMPDLVLMDVEMPGMDGYETTRHIREISGVEGWIPIIFLTAREGDACLERGIDAGGDDYLIKPIRPQVLGAKLKAMARIAHMRADLLRVAAELEAANAELEKLSTRDGLTGIANRRAFDTTLAAEWKRAARSGRGLGLLLIDVDFFKPYNDFYGHQGGDDCLIKVAAAITEAVPRAGDLVARYGGEEFAVVVTGTEVENLVTLGERVRATVAGRGLPHEKSSIADHVTVSVGAAMLLATQAEGPEALIARADKALYGAKAQGRNCVVREMGAS